MYPIHLPNTVMVPVSYAHTAYTAMSRSRGLNYITVCTPVVNSTTLITSLVRSFSCKTHSFLLKKNEIEDRLVLVIPVCTFPKEKKIFCTNSKIIGFFSKKLRTLNTQCSTDLMSHAQIKDIEFQIYFCFVYIYILIMHKVKDYLLHQ